MALISLNNINVSFGGPAILDDVTLQIEHGERICLLGRNGAGKTTLMKLLNNQMEAQSGDIAKQPGLKVAMLTQEVPDDIAGTVFDVAASGLGKWAKIVKDFHDTSLKLTENPSDELIEKLGNIQHDLESGGGWQLQQNIETVITRLSLDAEAKFNDLSAGLKRRTLLARALVNDPDILLLDEPTNHLDINSIDFLEDFLLRHVRTLVFVTHDRMFLKKLATRIVEIDRGRLTSWACDYENYLKRKQQLLDAEEKQNALFDKKLAEEEAWIRKGIKARRTRNEGRVRALVEMRNQRSDRRNVAGTVRMETQNAAQSGTVVIDAKGIDFAYPESGLMIDNLTTTIMRGDRIGIIGPNGSGKTTLINVLLGKLKPQQGKLRHGTNLEIGYFDQLHAQLDDSKTLWENVGEGYNTIEFNGRQRHVIGYLQDFMFMPSQSKKLVETLSGGERNRLLLAKLFSKPANVLVLDEPTNDLDIETLDLLEELLMEFKGTVLIVSHDRQFINNVVTSTLVLEGNGKIKEYAGGYDDWVRQRSVTESVQPKKALEKKQKPKPKSSKPKLTYKQQKELEALPEKIDQLETALAELHGQMANPDFYKKPQDQIAAHAQKTESLQAELDEAYARWEELEELKD